MIVASNGVAAKHGGLATTGVLNVLPGSVNTIPGEVLFSLDIRAGSDQVLENMEREIKRSFADIAGKDTQGSCQVEWKLDAESHATRFHDHAINCINESCEKLFKDNLQRPVSRVISGAGHDSVFTNRRAPTAMVFVPCKDGISHNPMEYCEPADCAIGAQVLVDALFRFDDMR